MDIKQPLACSAVVTLGKDMTWRDFAQGAYRMRGIGKGQTIALYVIPEVTKLVEAEAAAGAAPGAPAASPFASPAESARRELCDVAAWLHVNAMRAETLQFNLLCEQSVRNVWRKAAYRNLIDLYDADRVGGGGGGAGGAGGAAAAAAPTADELHAAVEVFRERVDLRVESTVPEQVALARRLSDAAAAPEHARFLESGAAAKVEEIVARLRGADAALAAAGDESERSGALARGPCWVCGLRIIERSPPRSLAARRARRSPRRQRPSATPSWTPLSCLL